MKKRYVALLLAGALLAGCGIRPGRAESPRTDAQTVFAPAGSASPAPTAAPTATPAPTPVPTPCPHASHDGETRRCTLCGELIPHNYVKDVCTLCGGHPAFFDTALPRDLFEPCQRQGRIERVSYTTTAYTPSTSREPVETQKQVLIYYPWGYDPAERYNVLVLLHGIRSTEATWLESPELYVPECEERFRGKDLLDNLIDRALCEKLVVVTPTFYRDSADQESYKRRLDQPRFIRELREDIMPLIVENVSTWAESGSEEDIIAAREHFGFAGLSMGGGYIYTGVIPDCLDYYSWFGCFSGSDGYMDYLANLLNHSAFTISYFYNSVGTRDPYYYYLHTGQYNQLVGWCDILTPGENAAMTEIADLGHECGAWAAGLANFLSVAFAEECGNHSGLP